MKFVFTKFEYDNEMHEYLYRSWNISIITWRHHYFDGIIKITRIKIQRKNFDTTLFTGSRSYIKNKTISNLVQVFVRTHTYVRTSHTYTHTRSLTLAKFFNFPLKNVLVIFRKSKKLYRLFINR